VKETNTLKGLEIYNREAITMRIANLFFDTLFNFPEGGDINFTNTIIRPDLPKYPISDIWLDKEKTLFLELAVTGFDENELDLSIRDNILTIKAEKKEKENREYFYSLENKIAKRNFTISYRIGDTQNLEKLIAKLKNGILQITIPEHEEEKAKLKKIKIEK